MLKLRHFLRIYDYFSAADWSWFSSGFPIFFDIICSQMLLYYFEIYPKKRVIQTKGKPGTMLNKNASMVDSREGHFKSRGNSIESGEVPDDTFLHMTEHSNLSVSSELKP